MFIYIIFENVKIGRVLGRHWWLVCVMLHYGWLRQAIDRATYRVLGVGSIIDVVMVIVATALVIGSGLSRHLCDRATTTK